MPAEAGISQIHIYNHIGKSHLSNPPMCSGNELPIPLTRALSATSYLQTFHLNTSPSSEVINTPRRVHTSLLEVFSTIPIERLALDRTRYNVLKSTSVLALKDLECREKCYPKMCILLLRLRKGMAIQTQPNCGLSTHGLFINSVLVGRRMGSVRTPQKLKETDYLLTLMILYMRGESYNVRKIIATYY